MGMFGIFVSVSGFDLERMKRDPDLARHTFDASLRETRRVKMLGHLERFQEQKQSGRANLETIIQETRQDLIDLETETKASPKGLPARFFELYKAWHAFDFMLSGQSAAARVAILADQTQCLETEGAFGPPRYLTVAQAKEAAAAVASVDESILAGLYRSGALRDAKVHGHFGSQPDNDSELQGLLNLWRKFVEFYQTVSANGEAILFDIY